MSENISADLIFKYFPNLSEEQRRQFEALDALYHDWNAKSMSSPERTSTISIPTTCSIPWVSPRSSISDLAPR